MEVRAEVAQVVEHGTENAGVDSSSLSLGTFLCLRIREGLENSPIDNIEVCVGRRIETLETSFECGHAWLQGGKVMWSA